MTKAYVWTLDEKGSVGVGTTISVRKPFLLSTGFNGEKCYLAAPVDSSRNGGGLQKVSCGGADQAGAEWRFIGPIDKN